jgi:hypothetical protein
VKKVSILVLALLLVLCLFVTVFANDIQTFLQVKSDWGQNGVIVIPLSSDPDYGVRIDGTFLLLI